MFNSQHGCRKRTDPEIFVRVPVGYSGELHVKRITFIM